MCVALSLPGRCPEGVQSPLQDPAHQFSGVCLGVGICGHEADHVSDVLRTHSALSRFACTILVPIGTARGSGLSASSLRSLFPGLVGAFLVGARVASRGFGLHLPNDTD